MDPQSLKSAMSASPDCLSAEQLERLLEQPSHSDAHVISCLHCQAELAMLKAFQSDAPLPDEGAAVAWISSHLERKLDDKHSRNRSSERPPSWLSVIFGLGGFRWAIPVAAIAIIAVTVAILWRNPREPELRAGLPTSQGIYRSQEVEVVTRGGDLSAAPAALEWKGFPGAVRYKITLMEVDREPIWSVETRDTKATIPKATRAKMLPGKPLLWQVSAVNDQGQTLAISQVQRFSVSRKSPTSGN